MKQKLFFNIALKAAGYQNTKLNVIYIINIDKVPNITI